MPPASRNYPAGNLWTTSAMVSGARRAQSAAVARLAHRSEGSHQHQWRELEQVIQLCRRVKAADHSQVIGVPNLLT
jgi:3'-phosphoadenosine 5'-phosphosulfate sulfotransferase (PAPS reductase)/FAD synthetase